MDERKFYVYEWYIEDTNEVFYVGKGTGDRYKRLNGRNYFFKCMYDTHNCNVRKIFVNLTEKEAFEKEIETIKYYRENATPEELDKNDRQFSENELKAMRENPAKINCTEKEKSEKEIRTK